MIKDVIMREMGAPKRGRVRRARTPRRHRTAALATGSDCISGIKSGSSITRITAKPVRSPTTFSSH
jgi:hypothetical protein